MRRQAGDARGRSSNRGGYERRSYQNSSGWTTMTWNHTSFRKATVRRFAKFKSRSTGGPGYPGTDASFVPASRWRMSSRDCGTSGRRETSPGLSPHSKRGYGLLPPAVFEDFPPHFRLGKMNRRRPSHFPPQSRHARSTIVPHEPYEFSLHCTIRHPTPNTSPLLPTPSLICP